MTSPARKLTVAALTTLDGAHDQPRSFAGPYFDAEAVARSLAELRACDAMLMGRTTYDYFAPAWSQATDPYARRLNDMTKYVYSSTLPSADWSNTTLVRGDAVQAVRELKETPGGDLMIYGYGRLARSLVAHGLVDRVKFLVFPVAGGTALRLASTETLGNGTVELAYTPPPSEPS